MEIGWGKYFPHFLNTDGSKHRSTSCSIELLTFLPVETEIQGKQPFCRFWRKDGASSESNARRADACQTLLLGSLGGSRVQAAAYRVLKCSTYRKI